MTGKRLVSILVLTTSITGTTALMLSCNLTGGIDSANSRDEQIVDAQAKMDAGDCTDAVTELTNLTTQDDRSLQILGTADMCSAGAGVNQIDGALAQYNASSTNLTVVGTLANSLFPIAGTADAKIASAVATFGFMGPTNERALWQIYSNIVRIAALMTKAAETINNWTSVTRAAISPSSCLNANCATAPAGCTGAGMNDADATTALNALTAAATAANNTTLTNVANLATQLQKVLGGSASANAMRCVLYNQTLTN